MINKNDFKEVVSSGKGFFDLCVYDNALFIIKFLTNRIKDIEYLGYMESTPFQVRLSYKKINMIFTLINLDSRFTKMYFLCENNIVYLQLYNDTENLCSAKYILGKLKKKLDVVLLDPVAMMDFLVEKAELKYKLKRPVTPISAEIKAYNYSIDDSTKAELSKQNSPVFYMLKVSNKNTIINLNYSSYEMELLSPNTSNFESEYIRIPKKIIANLTTGTIVIWNSNVIIRDTNLLYWYPIYPLLFKDQIVNLEDYISEEIITQEKIELLNKSEYRDFSFLKDSKANVFKKGFIVNLENKRYIFKL